MTEREPYLALRGFHVWFQKRRGFFEALRRSDPGYIRAVDGIDVTIGKGEIYCLVGESGCGKTTTGKGILRLVEPTAGDVFLNPTPAELADYERARDSADKSTFEAFRERRSLIYKETVHRKPLDYVRHGLVAGAGAVVGVLAAFGIILGSRAVGVGAAELLAYIVLGVSVGFAGTLPWVKVSRRIPLALGLGTIPASVAVQMLAVGAAQGAAGAPTDFASVAGAYVGLLQNPTLFLALIEALLAIGSAWYAADQAHRFWDQRHGVVTDRLRTLRTKLQIIFQDPYESLNPRHTVFDIVAEPLLVNRITRSRAETEARVQQALDDAGLRPPKDYMLRYPHEMSGGQRQRVSIAGALVLEPEFLVADEPVSMLDVSIRTEIIELLLNLRQKRGLTYLFITHDLSLAWVMADRIGVMYLGKIVEEGPTEVLIAHPRHPYTKALISVVPIPDPDRRHERMILRGERPDPSDIPPGCRFHPRCPVAFERCGWSSEEVLASLRDLAKGEALQHLESAAIQGPGAIVWPHASPDFEAWLRELIAAKAEEHRALKAIQAVERMGDGAKVILHPFEEPTLKTVAPGVQVSCHLFP
jgi:oligopeptide/dipeptide ABC transporter ATP-binding protein